MRALRVVGIVVVAGLVLLLPKLAGPFWMGLATQMCVFGLLALAVDLLLGPTGLFSVGHASFFAVAAYTTAILHVRYAVPTGLAAYLVLRMYGGDEDIQAGKFPVPVVQKVGK